MASTSLFYYSPELGQTIPYELTLAYTISAAETISPSPMNHASYTTFGAISSQSVIDDFLGTEDEFDYQAFNAQAMGTDCMGIIVNMQGQARSVHGFNFNASAAGGAGTGAVATAAGTTVTITSTGYWAVGDVVTVSGAAGFTTSANVNGTWVVSAVTGAAPSTAFSFVVDTAPAGGPGTANFKFIDPVPGRPFSRNATLTPTLVQSIGHPSDSLVVGGVQNTITVGEFGNIAMKINAPGLDSSNTGVIIVKALWFPK